MFYCETDHVFDTQNTNIAKQPIQDKMINVTSTPSESDIEYTNIANTSDYIGSLLSIISGGASEKSFNGNIVLLKSI